MSLMTCFGLFFMTMTSFLKVITEFRCQIKASLLDLLLFYMDSLRHRIAGSQNISSFWAQIFSSPDVQCHGYWGGFTGKHRYMDRSSPCVGTCKGLFLLDKPFENYLAQTTNFTDEETKEQICLLAPEQAPESLFSFFFYKDNKTT